MKVYKDATGRYVKMIAGQSFSIGLYPQEVEHLSQKEATMEWLRQQPADMVFSPNSCEQCVYGRMFRDIFGKGHDFCVCFDTVSWEDDDCSFLTFLTRFAARYQKSLLQYIKGRDNGNDTGTVTRKEALRIARLTSAQ